MNNAQIILPAKFNPEVFINTSWFIENYINKIEFLGEGGFGVVVSAIKKRDKQKVAIKLMKTENIIDLNHFVKEAIALSTLKHPNILEFIDHHIDEIKFKKHNQNFIEYQLFISMEKAEGTLHDLLERKEFTMKEFLKVMIDLIKALHHAHSHKISHNDIKPQNIFYCKDAKNEFVYKIGDWGSGAFLKESNTLTSFKQGMGFTKSYASPEIIKDIRDIHFYKSDIYSLGLTLLRSCGVKFKEIKNLNDYEEEEHDQKVEKIFKNLMEKMEFNKQIVEILRNMLSYKFDDRHPLSLEIIKLVSDYLDSLKFKPIINTPVMNYEIDDKKKNIDHFENKEIDLEKNNEDFSGSKKKSTIKLLLIGESGAGKTCLISKFFDGTFLPNHLATSIILL